MHCDLALGYKTLDEGLLHPPYIIDNNCEILVISNKAVRSYILHMDFGYMCTVALILDM